MTLSLLLFLVVASTPALTDEMRFVASYRGVFSGGAWLELADVNYVEGQPVGDEGLRVSEVHASSERQQAVETLYPIRYLARSLYQPSRGASLAFERFKHTRRVHHDLFRIDPVAQRLLRYRLDVGAPMPDLTWTDSVTGVDPDGDGLALPTGSTGPFDQLALISVIRRLDWDRVVRHDLSGTDGKRLLDYRLSVVADEVLDWGGRSIPTWKIRIEAWLAEGQDDAGEPRHRPLLLWLSKDGTRRPMRVEHRYLLGQFRLELMPDGAGSGPWIVPSVVDQLEIAGVANRSSRLFDATVLE